MALLLKADGSSELTQPSDSSAGFLLDELYSLVGEPIEIVHLKDGMILVINEEGKLNGLPFNNAATALLHATQGPHDFIVGTALLCKSEEVK